MELLLAVFSDLQPGRLMESLIFLGVLLWRVNPHLHKIENRMLGVESALNLLNENMSEGFSKGEKRFQDLETRVIKLESEEGETNE